MTRSAWRERAPRAHATVAPGEPPELYWVRRGTRVIGVGDLTELRRCRQLATYRAIHELLPEHGPAARVLDVGCNVAALGRLLADFGFAGRTWGLDRNPHAVRLARQLHPPSSPLVASARALPLAARSMPVVVMKDVLEHLEDFRPALAEALRVAGQAVVVGCFLPWTDGSTRIVRHARGFFENTYARAEVYEFLAERGWRVERTVSTVETDGRPNEVLRLRAQ